MDIGADSLPREVLVTIFSYLSLKDLVNSVQFVCTWWQQVSWEKSLWKYITYNATFSSSKHVIKMLKISPQLRTLDLKSVTVDNNLIHYVTDSCPNIERLIISWDSIYNCEEVTITRPMKQIKILSLVSLQKSLTGSMTSVLRHFKTQSSSEFDIDFQYLDSTFPNLESLYIAGLKFTGNDLALYLEKKQDSLHTLSTSCCTDEVLSVLPYLYRGKKLRKLSVEEVCSQLDISSCKQLEHLQNITHLSLRNSLINNISDSSSVLRYFPNIIELELYACIPNTVKENILHIIARNCPQLRKLNLHCCLNFWGVHFPLLRDATLKYALHLERLTHLSIYENLHVTDEGIKHLLLIPELIHLDLYGCKLVTTASLKLICGLSKLEVLKFDLRNKQLPADLRASDVKNKNLQLLFYHCRDVSSLDSLKQQHLRLGLAKKQSIDSCLYED